MPFLRINFYFNGFSSKFWIIFPLDGVSGNNFKNWATFTVKVIRVE